MQFGKKARTLRNSLGSCTGTEVAQDHRARHGHRKQLLCRPLISRWPCDVYVFFFVLTASQCPGVGPRNWCTKKCGQILYGVCKTNSYLMCATAGVQALYMSDFDVLVASESSLRQEPRVLKSVIFLLRVISPCYHLFFCYFYLQLFAFLPLPCFEESLGRFMCSALQK